MVPTALTSAALLQRPMNLAIQEKKMPGGCHCGTKRVLQGMCLVAGFYSFFFALFHGRSVSPFFGLA